MWSNRYLLQSFVWWRNFKNFTLRNFCSSTRNEEVEWNKTYQRGVPRTKAEMLSTMMEEVDSPPNAKLLKVAIIGLPNSGKSTLINKLTRWRVCSVSSKVHTTKVQCRAILNEGVTQIVFLDTPGLVNREEASRFKLDRSLLLDAEMSLQSADLMAVIHDMSHRHSYCELHPRVLRLLALYPKIPSILIMNKLDVFKSKSRLFEITRVLTDGIVGGNKDYFKIVEKSQSIDEKALIKRAFQKEVNQSSKNNSKLDKEALITKALRNDRISSIQNQHIDEKSVFEGKMQLTERQVLEFIKDRKSWPKFQEIFMISALEGSGVDNLRDYLVSKAYSASWLFNSKCVTDQSPEEIILLTIREKFLEYFKDEIPYTSKFDVEYWDLDSGVLTIVVKVVCRRKGMMKQILGVRGFQINNLTTEAQKELQKTFRTPVSLQLNVVYEKLRQK